MRAPDLVFCEEGKRLLDLVLEAIHLVNDLQSQQVKAMIEGDSDFSRFDVLIFFALEKKDAAKYEWMTHVEAHGCTEL